MVIRKNQKSDKDDMYCVHKFEKGFLSYDKKVTRVGYSIQHRPFTSPAIYMINKRPALITDNKGTVHQIFILEEEKINFSENSRYMYHLLFNQIDYLFRFVEHMIESCNFFINKKP